MKSLYCSLCLILMLVLMNFSTNGQGYTSDSIPGISLISTDQLGNCYAASGSELMKLDINGKHLLTFSRKDYGNITQLDTRDPLRLLLFYRDFGVLRILDNQLGEQSVLDLRASGINDAGAVVSAIDDGLWIFDRISNQLLRYDSRLQQQRMALDLFQLLGHPVSATGLQAAGDWLLLTEEKQCYLFDRYGTFVKKFPLQERTSMIQLGEQTLNIGDSTGLHLIDLRLNAQQDLPLPWPPDAQQACISRGNTWVRMSDKLLRIPSQK